MIKQKKIKEIYMYIFNLQNENKEKIENPTTTMLNYKIINISLVA